MVKDSSFLFLLIIGVVVSLFVLINYATKAGIIYLVLAMSGLLLFLNFEKVKSFVRR